MTIGLALMYRAVTVKNDRSEYLLQVFETDQLQENGEPHEDAMPLLTIEDASHDSLKFILDALNLYKPMSETLRLIANTDLEDDPPGDVLYGELDFCTNAARDALKGKAPQLDTEE